MFVALCSWLRIAAWGLDGYTATREECVAGDGEENKQCILEKIKM